MIGVVVVLALSAPASADCARFMDDFEKKAAQKGARLDVAEEIRFGLRSNKCQEPHADAEDDARIRALPPAVRDRAVCLLGSPALDDARRAVVDGVTQSLSFRGQCLVALARRDPQILAERAFTRGQRVELSLLVLSAAKQAEQKEEALFAQVLQQAHVENAVGRWELKRSVCRDKNPEALAKPCSDVDAEEAKAAEDAAVATTIAGGVLTGLGAVGAGAVWLVAALALQDTFLAIPIGIGSGAFFGAALGGVLGGAIGVSLASSAPSSRAPSGLAGVILLPMSFVADILAAVIVVGVAIAVGVAAGAAVFGTGGGIASAFEGPPRVTTYVVGAVGVVACISVVGGAVTVLFADSAEAEE